jgi:hypothetical protein
VKDETDFQKQAQKIGELVRGLENIADPAARATARELVQSLMELHGAGLERTLEIVFRSGESGARIIDDLGQDPLVSSLLVLYGIHPDDLETRVGRKLREIDSRLHKMGAGVTSVNISGSEIRLHIKVDGHACGSTSRTVKAVVEEAIYEAAPDLTSLVVEGLEEPASTGFVGLAALSSAPPPVVASPLAGVASEGMD